MKIFITGVAGMLGSHLSEILLKKNHTVYGLDNLSVGTKINLKELIKNKKFKFIKADINNGKKINQLVKICDVTVHLAAKKKVTEIQSAYDTLITNVYPTKTILDAVKKYSKRLIFASTSDVYGISKKIPFKETGDLVLGQSLAKRWSYAASKIYCEHLCYSYYKDFKIKVTILRFFGGFSHKSSFSWSGGHIPLFIDKILQGKTILIHGDGKQTRSMGHAQDLAQGTYLAIISKKANGKIINIGNNEEVSVLGSVKLIAKEMKIKMANIKIKFIEEQKIFGNYRDIRRRKPDLSLAKKILGYKPEITLKKAIKLVINEKKINHK